ncbi:MAG: NADP-dependent oxidoreductase [Homoserinimonas sp.]|nr:NADP-dependent oxidoreductase [Homoserinimonas sp.]
MMRAMAIAQAGDPFFETEIPLPVRINSEVLVKVHAAAINPLDFKTRVGRGVTAAIANYPAILGYDFSGVVEETPYELHPLAVGTEVFGMTSFPRGSGSYAEYVSVSSLSVAKKPTNLTHVEAAGVPLAALTAWGLVVDVAKAHDGQRILIHAGAGGVGHFAVQLAAYFGAHVISTGSQRNCSWLRDLGASQVIDYTTERFEHVTDQVDVVIDMIGNVHEDTGSRSLEVLRPGGLIVNVPTGSWPTFLTDAAAAGMRATTYKVAPDASRLAIIARLLQSGEVHVNIDQVFDLARVGDAHAALEAGHTRGKIALRVAH